MLEIHQVFLRFLFSKNSKKFSKIYWVQFGKKSNIWDEIKPLLTQAIGQKIDSAILFGVDKPADFRASLVDSIYNAGSDISATTNFYSDIRLPA
jgi:hypothetical protein